MGGYDCLQHIYRWVWLFRVFLWVGVGGCDWVWMSGENGNAQKEHRFSFIYNMDIGKKFVKYIILKCDGKN